MDAVTDVHVEPLRGTEHDGCPGCGAFGGVAGGVEFAEVGLHFRELDRDWADAQDCAEQQGSDLVGGAGEVDGWGDWCG